MTATVFLAVLAAALIHASWNAVIKTGADRYQAMLLLTLTQGVMALAMVFWFPVPAREAWPWLLGSGFFHTFYKLFLSAAYHRGYRTTRIRIRVTRWYTSYSGSVMNSIAVSCQ